MMAKIIPVIIFTSGVCLYGQRSPGEFVAGTLSDYMCMKQRIMVDDYDQAHITYILAEYSQQTYGTLAFRFREGGSYFPIQVAPGGHMLLDITRDANPDMQRTVVTYHYDAGAGYYSWIDIDAGNCWGAFPNNPIPLLNSDYIWPMVTATCNGNIAVATAFQDNQYPQHLLSITDDEGVSWPLVILFDSCSTHSHFVRGSHNSPKLVFAHTHYITDSIASGQLDNDVYFILSTDGGMTWGTYTNITRYQPDDSVRAYADVCACFDDNDNLHLVWSGRRVVNGNFYEASKIFHWDEVHDTITVVNSPSTYYNDPGGWWITTPTGGSPGAWRMPADYPQIIADHTNGFLYCLWQGNDDYNDSSAGGFFNGELFGSYSTDHGLTWADYVNLTNTRSPGAGPGSCEDEDYMTANPFVVDDSIFITYVEDKDAGWYAQGEGALTENPVMCWVFATALIRSGVEEYTGGTPSALSLHVAPNPFRKELKIQYALSSRHYTEGVNSLRQKDIELRIYDASGRLVKSITQLPNYPITWEGNDQYGTPVPAGVYFVTLKDGEQNITQKIVKLR